MMEFPDAEMMAVLKGVSRSFVITIRALPRGLRRPVGLAYLLARASDTIAEPRRRRLKRARSVCAPLPGCWCGKRRCFREVEGDRRRMRRSRVCWGAWNGSPGASRRCRRETGRRSWRCCGRSRGDRSWTS